MRPSEIQKSEKHVSKVINVLEDEYLNPFGLGLDPTELYNLSSGVPKEDGVKELLEINQSGNAAANEFLANRILTSEKKFHDPITRVKIPTFQEHYVKIKKIGSEKVIQANREVLSKLLSLSAKFGKPIDFKHAFTYLLYPYPLSMAFTDGTKRETSKSQLLHEIIPDIQDKNLAELGVIPSRCGYVIDMIAHLRVFLVSVHETFEELSMKFLQSLPKGYARLDIVADTYRKASIKSSERRKRGSSAKTLIGSIKSKVQRDMNKFMVNDENKTLLIKLIFNFILDQKEQVLRMLKTEMLILSGDDESFTITVDMIRENQDLTSNQEEADTKVILHTMNVLEEGFTVVLRSPLGDTDIMVLALVLISDLTKVFMNYRNGKNRKRLSLKEIRLLQSEKEALVGFHSFTGNDYIPSIFQKGKKHCWSIAKCSETFLEAFSELGADWEMTDEVVLALEKYVCALYRSKNNSVNELRYELFLKQQKKEGKVIDLAAVPPCFSSLYLQIKRANYVSKI